MKKLKLIPNAFNQGEVLTRAELKKVMGGNAASVANLDPEGAAKSTCKADCPNGGSVTCYGYNGVGCSTVDGSGCTGNDVHGTGYWNAC